MQRAGRQGGDALRELVRTGTPQGGALDPQGGALDPQGGALAPQGGALDPPSADRGRDSSTWRCHPSLLFLMSYCRSSVGCLCISVLEISCSHRLLPLTIASHALKDGLSAATRKTFMSTWCGFECGCMCMCVCACVCECRCACACMCVCMCVVTAGQRSKLPQDSV